MRLICFWCAVVAIAHAQDDGFYTPQTYRQNVAGPLFQPTHNLWNNYDAQNRIDSNYQKPMFTPAGRDVTPQGTNSEAWRPAPVHEPWRGPGPLGSSSGLPKPEPWRLPYPISKEQQAAILHHKQALSSEGSFRFEYASDNGLAAGEVIEPDGSRVGGYQYKDPNGQIVKLKYRAGKDGFQILEGSHLPKSPEPVPPSSQGQDNHYQQAYEQQRQQYQLQQQYNQQRTDPQQAWRPNQENDGGQRSTSEQYYVQNWRPRQNLNEDDGQYRENEIDIRNKGPHNFGEGYAFAFKG